MANAANHRIRDDYQHYLSVVNGLKTIQSTVTLRKGGANNANWSGATVEIQHESVTQPIQFFAEKNVKHPTNYKFKLLAAHLAQEPVLRFDSDGASHRNDLDNIPLPERQVTTPHFHRFNEDGIGIAYKTDVLNSNGDAAAIVADANFGMAHFATEANLNDGRGNAPTLQDDEHVLLPPEVNQDPVAGVNFE
jgi:hypothetical protein